jgi:hypothetical protein
MSIPSRELTDGDLELIEFARRIVDANTGRRRRQPRPWARRAVRAGSPGAGVRSVRIKDVMPLGAVWTVEEGTQDFDPAVFY